MDFSQTLWRKVSEDLRIPFISETCSKFALRKLQEMDPLDMNVDVKEISAWSPQNLIIYEELKRNGYSEAICNKEYISSVYTQLILQNQNIEIMDSDLKKFINLTVLNLNQNLIKSIGQCNHNLKELYLYNNKIEKLSPSLQFQNLQYLGIANNMLQDSSLDNIGNQFPSLTCLDIAFNNLCNIEKTIDNLSDLKNIRILNLLGNPICLKNNYYQSIISEFQLLKFFDKQTVVQLTKKELEDISEQKLSKAFENQDFPDNNDENQFSPNIAFLDLDKSTNIGLIIQTMENFKGVQFEVPEGHAEIAYQSQYWISCKLDNQCFISKEAPVLISEGSTENDLSTVDFKFNQSLRIELNQSLRDQLNLGLVVKIHVREPSYTLEEDVKKPIIDKNTNLPIMVEKILGVCHIDSKNWLTQTKGQRAIQYKYNIFPEEVNSSTQFFFPIDNEDSLCLNLSEENNEQPKEEIKKDGKGGKDDKKKGTKGKEEAVKQVQKSDWEPHYRKYVYINEKKIFRSLKAQISIRLEILD